MKRTRSNLKRTRSIEVVVLLGAALLLPIGLFPPFEPVIPRLVQAEGNALFAASFAQRSVILDWVDPSTRRDRSDTRMQGFVAGETERRWRAVFSTRRRAHWPTAVWWAAVFATPMSVRRRAVALGVGTLTLNGFVIAQLAIIALCAFGATGPAGEAAVGWSAATRFATAMFNSPVPSYALVFSLWAWLARPSEAVDFERVTDLARRLTARR